MHKKVSIFYIYTNNRPRPHGPTVAVAVAVVITTTTDYLKSNEFGGGGFLVVHSHCMRLS